METEVDEVVKVWAFFDHGIFPIAMNWQRRFVKFEKLILLTTKMVGNNKIVDLICASDSANYELEFNADTYNWKVKRVLSKD